MRSLVKQLAFSFSIQPFYAVSVEGETEGHKDSVTFSAGRTVASNEVGVKEGGAKGVGATDGRGERYTHNFGWKSRRDQTTWGETEMCTGNRVPMDRK